MSRVIVLLDQRSGHVSQVLDAQTRQPLQFKEQPVANQPLGLAARTSASVSEDASAPASPVKALGAPKAALAQAAPAQLKCAWCQLPAPADPRGTSWGQCLTCKSEQWCSELCHRAHFDAEHKLACRDRLGRRY